MSLSSRRTVLQGGLAVATVLPMAARAQTLAAPPSFKPSPGPWRRFEVTTQVTVADPQGATQLWLPVPDLNSDFQRSLGDRWTGNAIRARLLTEARGGARMLHAEFAADEKSPTLSLISRVETRDRAVDWSGSPAMLREDRAALRRFLSPSALQPVTGIVRQTALTATQGAASDVEKVQAIYDWVVSNCYRDLAVRGCGDGKIEAMLESGALGGKCADLNSLFVAMCRSVGVPAREIYGLRLAPSAFHYHQLGADPTNLTGAQHCRAEVWLSQYGWVAMDPADVLKVMRQEGSAWIRDVHNPLIAPVYKGLFGGWEGNWVGWNTANDVSLPGASDRGVPPFLMYPEGESGRARFDELAPSAFRYSIGAHELAA